MILPFAPDNKAWLELIREELSQSEMTNHLQLDQVSLLDESPPRLVLTSRLSVDDFYANFVFYQVTRALFRKRPLTDDDPRLDDLNLDDPSADPPNDDYDHIEIYDHRISKHPEEPIYWNLIEGIDPDDDSVTYATIWLRVEILPGPLPSFVTVYTERPPDLYEGDTLATALEELEYLLECGTDYLSERSMVNENIYELTSLYPLRTDLPTHSMKWNTRHGPILITIARVEDE